MSPLDRYVARDDRHVVRQSTRWPQRYYVDALDGTPVGTVYYAGGRGYRCWRFDRREPTLVRGLTTALAHYRTA